MTARSLAAEALGDVGEDWLRAGTVIIAALEVGPHNKKLQAHTGVPLHDVGNYGYRLRQAGIWRRNLMVYPWIDDAEDGNGALALIGFTMQVGVAVGEFVMVGDALDPSFRLAMFGEVQGSPLTDSQCAGMPTRREVIGRRFGNPSRRHKVLV